MTPDQFAMLKGELAHADPKEIIIKPGSTDLVGGLSGKEGFIHWNAIYSYDGIGTLQITGQGPFAARIEAGIVEKLQTVLQGGSL
jgi:hypothetical protein